MSLIGSTSRRDAQLEAAKVDALVTATAPPDIVSDLSVRRSPRPLWRRVVEDTDLAAAALPVYTVRRKRDRIDIQELVETATEQIEGGVRLLTIHPTPSRELVALARKRLVPWTSRGGALVTKDLLSAGTAENVYLRALPHVAAVAAKHGCVISLGASFRSANIFDAADECQLAELRVQLSLAAELRSAGVDVILEAPGHARPSDIKRLAGILSPAGWPIMPLGPIPTDTAIGEDHVAAAIGVVLFGLAGCASIIAAVTREEHTGGVPAIGSTLEALRAARVAAHVIDLDLLGRDEADARVATERAFSHTCVVGRGHSRCARCADTCPLA